MNRQRFVHATLILPDRLVPDGSLTVRDGRIAAVGKTDRPENHPSADDLEIIDLSGRYLSPGFIDLHVHGGDGADFMDLTAESSTITVFSNCARRIFVRILAVPGFSVATSTAHTLPKRPGAVTLGLTFSAPIQNAMLNSSALPRTD
jgi:imidazolonepropionase-like amidohydrolase